MASHLVGVFWGMPGAVEAATATPPITGKPPWFFGFVAHPNAEPGPFGVALFFLVSGLVIPFSFRKRSVSGFLLGRVVRLWPTYAAALCLDVAVATLSSHHWQLPYVLPAPSFWGNLLLVEDYLGEQSIDLVNWSLGVEVRFYLLAALVVAIVGGMGSRTVLSLSLAIGLFVLWERHRHATVGPALRNLCQEAVYIQFMLIGCLFHNHITGRLSGPALAVAVVAGAALFALGWSQGPVTAAIFPVVAYSYGEALAVFTVAYLARDFLPRMAPVDRLADISYPVYLVQSILGYSLLKFFMLAWHMTYTHALLLTVFGILAVASALHLTIERPTMRLSHVIGRGPARAHAT